MATIKGGYCIIDFAGVDLTVSTAQTKDGIFNAVECAYETRKPCFAHGLVNGTSGEVTDAPIMIGSDGSSGYTATLGSLELAVSDDDEVTVS